MHSDMFQNNRMLARNKNLNEIKKFNPQALPPAGKNFYDYSNKNTFISAQKNGSMSIDNPPHNFKVDKYVIQKIGEQK